MTNWFTRRYKEKPTAEVQRSFFLWRRKKAANVGNTGMIWYCSQTVVGRICCRGGWALCCSAVGFTVNMDYDDRETEAKVMWHRPPTYGFEELKRIIRKKELSFDEWSEGFLDLRLIDRRISAIKGLLVGQLQVRLWNLTGGWEGTETPTADCYKVSQFRGSPDQLYHHQQIRKAKPKFIECETCSRRFPTWLSTFPLAAKNLNEEYALVRQDRYKGVSYCSSKKR